jgi:hypothetical protein
MMKATFAIAALTCCLGMTARAIDLSDTNSEGKRPYNLFYPTPDYLLRPIDSDQADNVIDAHTLDAGHIQVETSLINYYTVSTHYSFSGLNYQFSEDEYFWGPRFRVGLFNNVELEVNPTYEIRSANYNGAYSAPYIPQGFDYNRNSSGFGGVGVGPKINLWGDDDGPTAMAIHPFFSIPTRHGALLGGLDAPFGWRLPHGFYVKLNTGFEVTGPSHDNHVEFVNAASIHKSVSANAEIYWYLDSTAPSQSSESWFGYTGFGASYNVTSDLQIFGGVGFGLDSSAFDYNPRFGIIFRY